MKLSELQAERKKLENGLVEDSSEDDDNEEEEEEVVVEDNEEDEGEGEKRKKPKKSKGGAQTVYSNASKQLLIFCPPAVLTIHLKRFQQAAFSLRKVNRHVQFPLELDLAPFCSSAGTLMASGAVRYKLFAVVEHQGSLRSGHYTACVKVRPAAHARTAAAAAQDAPANAYERFYSRPPPRIDDVRELQAEMERKYHEIIREEAVGDACNGDPVPPSKWFYISDSHVSEVNVDKVLRSQAYLLFYERVE